MGNVQDRDLRVSRTNGKTYRHDADRLEDIEKNHNLLKADTAKHLPKWINVNNYGIIGDDTTEITENLKTLITLNAGSVIYIPRNAGKYVIGRMTISNVDNITIVCEGEFLLKAGSSTVANIIEFIDCDNLKINDFVIDANNNYGRLLVLTNCYKYRIQGGNFSNVGLKTEATASNAIFVRGTSHFGLIRDVTIKSVHSSTMASGIWLTPYKGVLPKHTLIDHCHIEDIYPIDDADGIKILEGTTEDADLTVINCTFIDCLKRAMKFQARGCKSISNTCIWNERGMYPIDFQRGYGSSLNDTIITNWEGDALNVQNGYFRCLVAIAEGNCTVDNLELKINTDTTWIKNVASQGCIVQLTPLLYNYVNNVRINNIKGAAGKLINTIGLDTVDNIKIKGLDVELFYSKFTDVTDTIWTNIDIEAKIKNSGGYMSMVNSNLSGVINLEIDLSITYTNDISFQNLKMSVKGSNKVSNNFYNDGYRTIWRTADIPSSYDDALGGWFKKCRPGDISLKANPAPEAGQMLTHWVCNTKGNTIDNPKGVWSPVYVSIE